MEDLIMIDEDDDIIGYNESDEEESYLAEAQLNEEITNNMESHGNGDNFEEDDVYKKQDSGKDSFQVVSLEFFYSFVIISHHEF